MKQERGLFGYKSPDDLGDCLLDAKCWTDEQIELCKSLARKEGYNRFQIVVIDGSLPNFIGALNLKR